VRHAPHRVAARALRSAVEESDLLASRCRDSPNERRVRLRPMVSATMLVPARLCLHDWSQTAVSGKKRPSSATRLLGPAREPQQTRQKVGHWRRVGMKDQPTLRFSLRSEAGRRLCFRWFTQHTLCVRSTRSSFHTFILFVQTLPARGCPSARNKGSHNVELCAAPLLHCHADC
jgi:hypothetical protein